MLVPRQTSVEVGVRVFGDLEAAVMDRLWTEARPMSVREVRNALAARREWAYTTVMTVMDNLHTKNWLRRSQHGRAYLYEPVAGREAYVAELMGEALRGSSDRTSAFIHFVSAMSPADTAALHLALRHLGRESDASDD